MLLSIPKAEVKNMASTCHTFGFAGTFEVHRADFSVGLRK